VIEGAFEEKPDWCPLREFPQKKMDDLISRQAAIDLLRNNISRDIQDQIATENNINLIQSMPTTYNVEKVVTELVEADQGYCWMCGGGIDVRVATDIVKRGGIE